MAKFNFPLQKLLNLKKYSEDQKAISLGQAQAALNKELYQLKTFEEMKNSLFNGDDFISVNLNALRSSNEYLIQINNQIEQQKQKIALAEKEVDEKRTVLMKANQEKKSVELLKDNQKQVFKKEANRVSQIKEDEVASRIVQSNRM
ncbi:MAG: flagellar export protein FliJ [Calditrichaeota bacterium]|nr:MAG: flagellar export protein FliJ [Calditrichota bacterium]MBL1204006.1 flagellar export protein FliJ [Calditrichota bacterium]NOG43837.1 flagellar export protein FliJ [Calditrichota bacterium]